MGGDPGTGPKNSLQLEYLYQGKKLSRMFEEKQVLSLDNDAIAALPGYLFRKDFKTNSKPVKARLHATALGDYRFQINGEPVGDDLMVPGWTAYQKRVETLTYDVTQMIHDGDNSIGAVLGEGWYAGTMFMRDISMLGRLMPKLLGQLELTYADGHTETIATDAAVAQVIHTDIASTGKFTSSSAKLNQLQSNIRWGQISNFIDLPTDCPQRDERLGWTGDAQVFLPTSCFNYGVYSFWARWLQTVRDEQTANGLQPYAKDQRGDTPHPVIATAYFGRDARILAWTATTLGKQDDATRYQKIHSDIRDAFSKSFIGPDGRISVGETQTGYLMALGYDLVTADLRPALEKQMLASFERADRHLRTGFLGTPLLAPVFESTGHPEISYELLFKDTYPSWFYSIDQGATTMWERWNSYSHTDGFDKGGMNSFNHYAYGAIGQWMYERVAGLAPDPAHPGYKHFFIRPLPGRQLTAASAELETPYGMAMSGWKKRGDSLVMDAVVPPNTTATIVFPTRNDAGILTSGELLNDSSFANQTKPDENGEVTLEIAPGTYQFVIRQWE